MGDMSREPSMEDILSSIRRVIARDEAPGQARDAKAAAQDILELHDEDGESADDIAATDPVDTNMDELVSVASADAARQSLEALTAAIAPGATTKESPPTPSGSRSMEDVVIDAMRPMLKQWLDTNLPEIVEAMVAKEIGRITGRRL